MPNLQIQNETQITGHIIQNLHVIKATDASHDLSNIYFTDIKPLNSRCNHIPIYEIETLKTERMST